MIFKDKLRFLIAKLMGKETVLFSKKDDREREIRSKIKGFFPFFYDFDDVDPNDFDFVVPLTIYAQKYVITHSEAFEKQNLFVLSDHVFDVCKDKFRFHHFLIENGFENLVPRINENFDYPYVLKKRIGAWGQDVFIITDSTIEQAHFDELNSGKYFTEEFIEGHDEYTAHIIVKEGTIRFLKVLKFTFLEQHYVKGMYFKPTTVEEDIDHSRFASIFEDILNKLEYQGICCFNYKIVNERLLIFEINPRFGASLARFTNEVLVSYKDALKS